MKIALVGPELEENLGLRYIASSLEKRGHTADIVAFNDAGDIDDVVGTVLATSPDITGLSMVFTSRGREFCTLATALRDAGYRGHIIGGGPFASFNCERVLADFPAFDSIGLGEGEGLMGDLAERLDDVSGIPGLCYRDGEGRPVINIATGNRGRLDDLPWPKRTTFDTYLGKPIASMLTSRGCWRNLRILQHQCLVRTGRRQEVQGAQHRQHRRRGGRPVSQSRRTRLQLTGRQFLPAETRQGRSPLR